MALTVLVACQQPATAFAASGESRPAAGKGQPRLPVEPLIIETSAGRRDFKVEVARTGAQQAAGLMFRPALAPDEGMIFPMTPARPAAFWMKNTPEPLDIIFIAPDRRIESIAAMTRPYSLDTIESIGPVVAVLEIAGGGAAKLGLAAGDRVVWSQGTGR